MRIYKGDIFYADLTPVVGCEQGGIRPVLIIQNTSATFTAPRSSWPLSPAALRKHPLPTHIHLYGEHYGLRQSSIRKPVL